MKSRYKPHWKVAHPLYNRWCEMKQRCYNPKKPEYKYYGGRGITVCDRWLHSFEDFVTDMGLPSDGPFEEYSIDRIDNDGNYEPSNVRWADNYQQGANKRLSARNTSGYRGVSWSKVNSKWHAYISCGGRMNLGMYDNKDDAARAYNEAAKYYYGPTAILNDVE